MFSIDLEMGWLTAGSMPFGLDSTSSVRPDLVWGLTVFLHATFKCILTGCLSDTEWDGVIMVGPPNSDVCGSHPQLAFGHTHFALTDSASMYLPVSLNKTEHVVYMWRALVSNTLVDKITTMVFASCR